MLTKQQIQEMILKTISTSDLSAGGLLNTEQAEFFIEEVFDSTPFLQAIRTETMTRVRQEFDKIGVGSRQLRGRTEDDSTHINYLRKPIFGKLELEALDYGLPFSITKKAMRDNIERQRFEQRTIDLFVRQTGVDTEDVAIQGNTVYTTTAPTDAVDMAGDIDGTTDPIDVVVDDVTGFPRHGTTGYILIDTEKMRYEYVDVATNTFIRCARAQDGTTIATHLDNATVTWVRDDLMGTDDGFIKQMYDGDAAYIDLATEVGQDLEKAHFFNLYRAMPTKYVTAQKGRLRWMMSDYQENLWLEYLTNRGTAAGDRALEGDDGRGPMGIPILSGARFPDDVIALADPQNLILGMLDQVEINKTSEGSDALYRRKTFYDIFVSMDFKIEETKAISFGDGLNGPND